MGCLAEETVIQFLAGGLSAEHAASVDDHVESCVSCRQLVRAVARSAPDDSRTATIASASVGDLAMSPTVAGVPPGLTTETGLARGANIGRYVVLDVLGKGGMGVVYAAFDPELDRKVALKLLRPELAAGEEAGAARLLREGRAIAKLAHPNVVTVFDVGTHDGAVFVAMELVTGSSLDHWIHAEQRAWRDVVAVFLQAGAGLIAAHAAGMVHRDFKPANVLMGADGRARVTDFGLARIGEAPQRQSRPSGIDVTGEVVPLTRTGAVLGTPAYMAPEQFDAKDVDEKSDQFSFAVALYEALYRERPFAGLTLGEIYASITNETVQPVPAGSAVPAWLREVVLRGMRCAPADRYPSLAAMLDELRRDPDAKRRKLLVAGGGGVAVLGVAAASVLFVAREPEKLCAVPDRALAGAWDATRRADVERAFGAIDKPYARDVLASVTKRLDEYATAWLATKQDACEATHVRHEQTEQHQGLRAVCLDERLVELRAVVDLFSYADVEVVRSAMTMLDHMRPLATCSDLGALTALVPPPSDPARRVQVEALRTRLSAARAIGEAGKFQQASRAAKQIVAEAEQLGYRPIQAESALLAGSLEERAGEPKSAERYLTLAIQFADAGRDDITAARAWIQRVRVKVVGLGRADDAMIDIGHASAALERLGGDPLEQAALDGYRALVLSEQAKYADALAAAQKALDARRRLLPANHLDIASSLSDIGLRHLDLANYEDSRNALQESLAIREIVLGPNHPEVAASLHNLGNAQHHLGADKAAEASYRRSLAIRERALGADHPEVALVLNNLATLLRGLGRLDEALDLYERAMAINVARFGPKHPTVGRLLHNVGAVHLMKKEPAKAIEFLEKGLAITIEVRGMEHPEVAAFYGTLAQAQRGRGNVDESLANLERALAIDIKVYGSSHPEVADDHQRIGEHYLVTGQPKQAYAAIRKALDLKEAALGKDHPDHAIALSNLGNVLGQLERYDEAIATYQRAIALEERALGTHNAELIYNLGGLGDLYGRTGQLQQAIPVLERALALEGASLHPSPYGNAQLHLGKALWDTNQDRARARQLVLAARETFAAARFKQGLEQAERWLKTHR